MPTWTIFLTLAAAATAQTGPPRPPLVRLDQDPPRPHPKLKLPAGHAVGPAIPGIRRQGMVPQGLAYWEERNWLLVSCYHEEGHPSVVVALDAKTGKMVRCLTLVDSDGKGHADHVGGLAVSEKYLWVGSGKLYRAPLATIAAAKLFDYLELQTLFRAECTASHIAYHDRKVWVGEFVSMEDGLESDSSHHLRDRNGTKKYAWATGYSLDADEDVTGIAGTDSPTPAAIFSVRQSVQGMTFSKDRVILSMSYGRTKNSTLAAYHDPLQQERDQPHRTVKLGGKTVPVWFLDGKTRSWEIEDLPPMSEGITASGKRLGVIFESGAEKYQKGGRGPLDSIIFLIPPAVK